MPNSIFADPHKLQHAKIHKMQDIVDRALELLNAVIIASFLLTFWFTVESKAQWRLLSYSPRFFLLT
jgi:cell division protein FtsB